jgi:ABC-type dipeptide/oligopeptide/nickel transport system permease component
MLRFILKRLGAALPAVFGVLIVTFVMARALPGDPAAYFAGPAATPEAIAQIRTKLGLDKSVPEQFFIYLADLARGDFGKALTTGQPVGRDLLARLPASLELTLGALFLSIGVAVPLGVAAATRPNSWVDHLTRVVATAGVSVPAFFMGLLLIYVFYFLLGIAPAPLGRLDAFTAPPPQVTGFYLVDSAIAGQGETFWAALKQLILPWIALGVFTLAPLTRITRASMIEALQSDFIRTARASGLPPMWINFRYAFRNAMLPVLTTLGMVFSFLLGGAVLVEKVFSWPGIGSFAIEALIASDYAPIQGFVLVMALLYVGLNLLIDILYGVIDPRVGLEA